MRKFVLGDEVYAFRGFGTGCCTEYKCFKETDSIELKPNKLSFQEAAACVDGASTAYFFLIDKACLTKGQLVLIIGASGSIGTFAVQIAKLFGAVVTGVCSSKNLELVKSLGADNGIDYTTTDYTKLDHQYDVIFDTVGKSSFSKCKKILRKGGCYIPTVGLHYNLTMCYTTFKSIIAGPSRVKKVLTGMSVKKNKALLFLKDELEKGSIKPVLDQKYPMEQVVEAYNYVEGGHKRGNVVINIY